MEHSIGNGEVDSSILSGSTSRSLVKACKISINSRLRLVAGFGFRSEQTMKAWVGRHKLTQRFAFCPLSFFRFAAVHAVHCITENLPIDAR